MVTIQQTQQQQLQQRRTQLEQAQQKLQAQQLQLTQQQLRTIPLIQRQKALQQFKEAKQKALGGVEKAFAEQAKYETQLQKAVTERETQVAEIASHQHDITVGRKFARKPEFWGHLTKRQRKYAESEASRRSAHSQLITQSQALKEVGLTFKELSPEVLKGLELPALERLEEVGVIELEKEKITPYEEYMQMSIPREERYRPVPTLLEPKPFDWKEYLETYVPLPKPTPLEKVKELGLGVTEAITWGVEKVGKVPIVIPEVSLFPRLGPQPMRISKVGIEAKKAKEYLTLFGITAERGWEEIIGRKRLAKVVPSYEKPIYLKETLIGPPGELMPPTKIIVPEKEVITELGLIPKVARYAPEVLAYTIIPAITLSVEALASAERMKTLKKDVKAEVEKQYKAHLKEEIPKDYRRLTKKEFVAEVTPEIESQMRRQIELETGLAVGLLGGLGVFRGVRALTRPRITYRQAQIPKPTFLEARVPVITPKARIDIAKYKVFQFRPPLEAKVTTRFREVLKMKPKIDWIPITKPQIYVSEPFAGLPVIGERPYIARIAKLRKTGVLGEPRYFGISGIQAPITPGEFMGLPKVQRYQLQQLIEQRIGRPIRMQDIPKFLKEEQQLVLGRIEVVDFLKRPGKRITREQVVSIIEPPKIIKPFKFYRVDVAFKEITKPFPRAIGKIPVIKGLVVELPPIIIGKGTRVKFLAPAKIKKTPFAVTFQEVKQIPMFVPLIPKVRPPKVIAKIIRPTPILEKGVGIQRMLGGLGLTEAQIKRAQGAFAFEVEEPLVVPGEIERVGVIIKPQVREMLMIKQIPKLKLELKQPLALKQIPKVMLAPKEMIKLREELQLKLALKQKLALRQRLKPIITPRPLPRPKPRPPKPRPKIVPKYIPKLTEREKKRLALLKKRKEELLLPYVKRYRKWIRIGEPLPRKKAIKVGIAKLRKTLAASLEIRKGERAVPFALPTKEFRLGKVGPTILVERAARRLKAREEVAEIIAIRKARKLKFLK